MRRYPLVDMGTIRDEIRQTKPFASAADEAVVTLLATADRVRTGLAQVVEAHGITLQQYNVLRILRGAGDEGLPTLEIAARMIEHSPGITRLLDRLEASRLVRRVRCPEDRRQVLCHATEAARRLVAGLDGPVAAAGRRTLAPLDPPRTADLIRLLDAVRATAVSSVTTPSKQDHDPEKKRKKETKA
jgi:MarR family transcriptional regulator, organic hydroperoxide resistance regulator